MQNTLHHRHRRRIKTTETTPTTTPTPTSTPIKFIKVKKPKEPSRTVFHIYVPKFLKVQMTEIHQRYRNCPNCSIILYGVVTREKVKSEFGQDSGSSWRNGKNSDWDKTPSIVTEIVRTSIIGSIVLNSSNWTSANSLLKRRDCGQRPFYWDIIGHIDLGNNNPYIRPLYTHQFTRKIPKIWLTFGFPNTLTPSRGGLKRSLINAEISSHFAKNFAPTSIIIQYDPIVLVTHYPRIKFSIPEILIKSFHLHQNAQRIFKNVGSELIEFVPMLNLDVRAQNVNARSTEYLVLDTSIIWKKPNLHKLNGVSRGLDQFAAKVLIIPKMFDECNPIEPHKEIAKFNLITFFIADMIVGIILSLILNFLWTVEHDFFMKAFENIEGQVGVIAKLLVRLMKWLHGTPGGLKLNVELNTVFFTFYTYHIWLWKSYIGLLGPLIQTLLTFIVQLGFLGFTVQVGFIKDLLSVATFHTYCLYVYATRFFNIELVILKSYGRLIFFGKKWNPLRRRMDTVHLNLSEMFFCSLTFTVAVFLVPTCVVYYVVFLLLRLPSFILESMLTFSLRLLNSLELYTAYLVHYRKSPLLSRKLNLNLINTSDAKYELAPNTPHRKYYRVPVISESLKINLTKVLDAEIIMP